jgi:hypothetical protein
MVALAQELPRAFPIIVFTASLSCHLVERAMLSKDNHSQILILFAARQES